MNDLRNIRDFFPALNDDNLIKLLLYGNDLFNDNKNQSVLMRTIRLIKASKIL